ncbi:MAG: TetR-like C-terminal domain-containing protein [Roseburia faecis]
MRTWFPLLFYLGKEKLRHSLGRPSRSDFVQYGFVGIMLDWIDKGMQEDYHKIVMMMGTALDGNIARSIENFKQK